jgi:hypothetical protein
MTVAMVMQLRDLGHYEMIFMSVCCYDYACLLL